MGKSVFELGVRVTASGKQVLTNLQNEQRKAAKQAAVATATWNTGLQTVGATGQAVFLTLRRGGEAYTAAMRHVLMATLAVVGPAFALKKALDFGVEGEQIRNIGLAFRALNKDATATLTALEEGFRGTLDVTSMQQIAVPLQAMNLGMKDMQRTADLAFKAYISKGGKAADVANSFATAVASGRTATLAQYGIIVSTTEAYQDMADKLNVNVRSLSELQRKQALLNKILEQGEKAFSALPMEELSLDVHHLSKQISDLWSDFNELAGGAIASTIVAGKEVGGVFEAMFSPSSAAAREEALWAMERQAEATRLEADLQADLHAILEESRAKRRELTFVMDEQGKVLANRIFLDSVYLEQLDQITALEKKREGGLFGLVAEEEKELASLKASTVEYGKRNLALAAAVRFEQSIDAARAVTQTTTDALVKTVVGLERALMDAVAVEAPERAAEHDDELSKLAATLTELKASAPIWTDYLRDMAAQTAEAADRLGDLRFEFSEQEMAAAAATDELNEYAESQGIINGLLRDPTPAENVEILFNELARAGPSAKLLKGLEKALLDVYILSGQIADVQNFGLIDVSQSGAIAEMKKTIEELKARAKAAYDGRSKTRKREVQDISDAELSMRLAILGEADALNRGLLESDLQLFQAEQALAGKRIGSNVYELEVARAAHAERVAISDDEKARAQSDAAVVVDLAKKRTDAEKLLADAKKETDRLDAQAHRDKMDRWREEDALITSRVSSAEANLSAMGMMGSELAEQMAGAMRPAQDAIMSFVNASRLSGKAQIQALAGGISASGAAVAAFTKDTKKQAIIRGLFEQASALASVARLDFVGAAAHQLAAVSFFSVAGRGGGQASALSGFQPSTAGAGAAIGASTGGNGGGGTTIINNMQGFGIGSLEDLGRWQAKALNAVAGESTLDPRIIGAAAGGV